MLRVGTGRRSMARAPGGLSLAGQIAAMFGSSEPGVWFDPSDFSTMYQDSAGTTPVTAVEQPVGLLIDKSKGGVWGSNIATNGTFDADSGWTKVGGAAISGGVANLPTGTDWVEQLVPTESGRAYKVTGTATNSIYCGAWDNAGRASVLNLLGGGTSAGGRTGTFSFIFVANDTASYIAFTATGAGATTLDNVTVTPLPLGNHATQATSASRPVLSARVNLLTKTQEFDDAAWSKLNCTITANASTAPDGTQTADLVVEDTTASAGHYPGQNVSGIVAGVSYKARGVIKANGRRYIGLFLTDGASAPQLFVIDTQTGLQQTISGATNLTGTVEAAGNGFYTLSTTWVPATGGTGNFAVRAFNGTTYADRNYTGNGTSGFYIWGADLRLSADTSAGPAYQRVNTATDYDTAGFKTFLRFDGVDDSLATGSINFTSTDKVTVFAGFQADSHAAVAMLTELSANANSNNGSFYLLAPASTSGNLAFAVRGTVAANAAGRQETAGGSAPRASVLTGMLNLAGTTNAQASDFRRNGAMPTLVDLNTLNNGGAFGNWPLYIGRRGGSSLPFNGRLYGLIVRGAYTDDARVASGERWTNSKTGAYA